MTNGELEVIEERVNTHQCLQIILDQMLFWAAMYKAFMVGGRGQFLEHILCSRIKGYSNEWGFFFSNICMM